MKIWGFLAKKGQKLANLTRKFFLSKKQKILTLIERRVYNYIKVCLVYTYVFFIVLPVQLNIKIFIHLPVKMAFYVIFWRFYVSKN